MDEFQKRGIERRGFKNHLLEFKCDKCGKIINITSRPEKNENSNGGCVKMWCDKCKTRE